MAVRDTIHRKLTYEDYVLIPEDRLRHEILDGEHVVSPAPKPGHQDVSLELSMALGPFIRGRQLGKLYYAPVDILLAEHNILQPDLVFISNERLRIIGEDNVEGAPDLVIEILSDSTRRRDEGAKRRLYERYGVLEYWLIDPKRRAVSVLRRAGAGFGTPEVLSAEAGDVLATPLLPGLEIRVSRIFM
ncbi:MAG TPA: Uma2 family endonuclease [Thermoanaerobaculia bacterium]|nr:Uma2 family endonuclease [Thermoanaerobaculia bacterium]